MGEVLRIQDRFKITGRGMLYMVKIDKHSIIHMGDLFYDLQGNRFKITGIEMIRRIPDGKNREDMPIGLLFELIDGVEAEGNILVSSLSDISFIFCNHPLYQRRVDEDYEKEYQAAGLEHACALFSYEDLEAGKLSLYGEDISGLTVYRGWMMKPELYRFFYEKLEEKGIILINTPEEYEKYHMLPGWYEDFKEDTAQSVWEDEGTINTAMLLTKHLEGPYIVKDYVKSRKHEWYDSCYIPKISDRANTEKIIRNFIDRQGSDLIGGVVLRQFVKLKSIGFHEKSGMPISEEYRVFAYAGRVMIIDDYWRSDEEICFSAEELEWIKSKIKKLKSGFVTMYIARREDGRLIIMELGDGQVSGLQQIHPEDFYRSFNPAVIHLPDEPIEEAISENAVILAGDPMPDVSVEDMKKTIDAIVTTQELVDAYVNVHNKFWFIEDEVYDYEKYTEEYERACTIVDAWGDLMDELDKRIMKTAEEEGLLSEPIPNAGAVKRLTGFMNKYGYRDGCGWWVKMADNE